MRRQSSGHEDPFPTIDTLHIYLHGFLAPEKRLAVDLLAAPVPDTFSFVDLCNNDFNLVAPFFLTHLLRPPAPEVQLYLDN